MMREKEIEAAVNSRQDKNIRFHVYKQGIVFQVGTTHMEEEVSLEELNSFCKEHGMKCTMVSDSMGIISK